MNTLIYQENNIFISVSGNIPNMFYSIWLNTLNELILDNKNNKISNKHILLEDNDYKIKIDINNTTIKIKTLTLIFNLLSNYFDSINKINDGWKSSEYFNPLNDINEQISKLIKLQHILTPLYRNRND